MILLVSSLFMELYMQLKRRQLIMNSLKNNECPYELSIEDLELL
jgi:hypothetical protein